MSSPLPINEAAAQRLPEALRTDLPNAVWTIGGAFRYSKHLQIILPLLIQLKPLYNISHVAGVLPCSWSMDWFAQQRPMPLQEYTTALETYAQLGLGVILVFDNPHISEADLEDSYIPALVQELYQRDRLRKNAVCVADDRQAAKLRDLFPKLPIHAHPNRIVNFIGKRTPSLYNQLLETYTRVCLHPADATRSAILNGLQAPERMNVIVNDPCLRTCPVRREHMQLLAKMRQQPYNTDIMAQRSQLLQRAGCQMITAEQMGQQNRSCNLSETDKQTLHNMGITRFIIQSQQFRNEMTFLWDIFRCIQCHAPERSNKMALIATAVMGEFNKSATQLPSGLRRFSFSTYE